MRGRGRGGAGGRGGRGGAQVSQSVSSGIFGGPRNICKFCLIATTSYI